MIVDKFILRAGGGGGGLRDLVCDVRDIISDIAIIGGQGRTPLHRRCSVGVVQMRVVRWIWVVNSLSFVRFTPHGAWAQFMMRLAHAALCGAVLLELTVHRTAQFIVACSCGHAALCGATAVAPHSAA